ncbi:hypothetical protein T440DRAFT_511985 [Plenodomus tracheiphilus IPT5]|uniref:Uncharacterized protein n=1 Tax=Plenodomus tracheiphilus IPT5 TaxID=1408161 RepID=A0A6A7ANY7_9PLEO|nr:hypothetical protein T440DRAFT_511985 [Plenodomus tracheiphilus IPT5]
MSTQELTPGSMEEAEFMASLTPDRTPEQNDKIRKYRLSRTGSVTQPIRIGGPKHVAMLDSMEDSFVAGPLGFPSRRPSHLTSSKPSPTQQTPAPTQPVARVPELTPRPADWKTKARKVIDKKQWNLDREMSRLTWKQKVSNDQRLLLLQDNGYDISKLLLKGTTADDIITVVLDCVEARKGDRLAATVAGSSTLPTVETTASTKDCNDIPAPHTHCIVQGLFLDCRTYRESTVFI